jgi:succinate dehydrogenase/fumarate reductase flavoprotein subunit
LTGSLAKLDALWTAVRGAGQSAFDRGVKAREAAAMLATARWMYRSALARTESRGMHKRDDFPDLDRRQRFYLVTCDLDDVQVWARPASRHPAVEIAA